MRQAYLRASLFAEQDASASEPRGGEAWCGGDFQRVSEMSCTRTQKMQGLLHSPIYNPCLLIIFLFLFLHCVSIHTCTTMTLGNFISKPFTWTQVCMAVIRCDNETETERVEAEEREAIRGKMTGGYVCGYVGRQAVVMPLLKRRKGTRRH